MEYMLIQNESFMNLIDVAGAYLGNDTKHKFPENIVSALGRDPQSLYRMYIEGNPEIMLPSGIRRIAAKAFYQCTWLTEIELPEGLESIGEEALNGTGLTEIVFPKSVKSIEKYAFSGSQITKITFKGTPDTIAETAFNIFKSGVTINVPWSEGEVAGAPWSTVSSDVTINYNYASADE